MNKKKIVIIGAGGHGRVVTDIARLNGYTDIRFLDDNADNKYCNIDGKISDFVRYLGNYDFFVAIGDNNTRKQISGKLIDGGANIVTLIHPNAVISQGVKIGRGSVIMAGVVINTNVILGNGVIVNTSSSVDHDCVVGNYTHISVGAHIAGTVNIGKNVFVGAGATVINDVEICDDCQIGAGATVITNIKESGTYIGVPVKKI